MRILALDTATEACSVALQDHEKIYSFYEYSPREHAQRILPMIKQILNNSGLQLADLDALTFTCGPGSFTGIRIATGVIQGLAFGVALPVIPISTFAVLAQGGWRKINFDRILVALDAKMGELYWGIYQRNSEGSWQAFCEPAVLSPDEVQQSINKLDGKWGYAGTGWLTYPHLLMQPKIELVDSTILLPNAVDLLPLALQDWNKQQAAKDIEPVYLRNNVAWKKNK